MDLITKDRRSWNMSRIRSKNTKPEVLVRKYLYAQGLRYRLHVKLPGRPDVVIKNKHIVIFINGCFWHSHAACNNAVLPKTNTDFWRKKISSNVGRDQKNYKKLTQDGWIVLTVWECELGKDREFTLNKLLWRITKEVKNE